LVQITTNRTCCQSGSKVTLHQPLWENGFSYSIVYSLGSIYNHPYFIFILKKALKITQFGNVGIIKVAHKLVPIFYYRDKTRVIS